CDLGMSNRRKILRRTKILGTIGPASRDPQIFEAMLAAGIKGVRINMSHGKTEETTAATHLARAAAEKMKLPLAVLIDLSVTSVRTLSLKNHHNVGLKTGQVFTITTLVIEGDATMVATN